MIFVTVGTHEQQTLLVSLLLQTDLVLQSNVIGEGEHVQTQSKGRVYLSNVQNHNRSNKGEKDIIKALNSSMSMLFPCILRDAIRTFSTIWQKSPFWSIATRKITKNILKFIMLIVNKENLYESIHSN